MIKALAIYFRSSKAICKIKKPISGEDVVSKSLLHFFCATNKVHGPRLNPIVT